MTDKPDLPEGYLGPQPKFTELGLQCVSHPAPEFSIPEVNEVTVQLKAPKPVKVTTNLINCRTDQEHSEYVFTQTKDGVLSFVLAFPEYGFYKFQIFALDATDESKSFPNAYNYVIEVKKALKPVFPFPKQYAQWKNGCFLYSPLVLHANARLANVDFKVYVPEAKAVAVVAAGEWVHLTKNGENFEGVAALDKHRGNNVKVTVNANFGPDETKYATLLEYVV